jgi:RNA polymerase primary sigma factor
VRHPGARPVGGRRGGQGPATATQAVDRSSSAVRGSVGARGGIRSFHGCRTRSRHLASWRKEGLTPAERAPTQRPSIRDELSDRRLIRAARRGDRGARERIVAGHLGLVRGVASRYRGCGLPFDDLVQEGSIGLLEAIDRFDPRRGVPFAAYARFRVRRAIRNALTDQARLIRLPRPVVERQRLLARTEERLAAAGRRIPGPAELAAATGLSLDTVVAARAGDAAPLSLDAPSTPDGTPLEAVVPDATAADPERLLLSREQANGLRAAVAALPDRRRRVVEGMYGLEGEPQSVSDVASELRLSRQRVRAIARTAIHELHGSLAASELDHDRSSRS